MPMEIQIITVKEFIRMGAHGTIDLEESQTLLNSIARAFIERGVTRALLDVRDARSDLTAEQIVNLVLNFRNSGLHEKQRIAVLHRGGFTPRSDLFADYATHQGWNVASFSNYEQAVDWLCVMEEADAGLHMYSKEMTDGSKPAL